MKRTMLLMLMLSTIGMAQAAPTNGGVTLPPNGPCTPPPLQVASICNQNGTTLVLYLPDGTAITVPDSLASPAVTSVFGRTGAVVAQTGDYSYSQISKAPSQATFPAGTAITGTMVVNGATVPVTITLTQPLTGTLQ